MIVLQTISEFHWNHKARNYSRDICDYEAIRSLFDEVDYVFHLAAEARLQQSIQNPAKAALTNVVGTCVVLKCAKEAGVKKSYLLFYFICIWNETLRQIVKKMQQTV
jgi:UDP-glucose 4-epimerase